MHVKNEVELVSLACEDVMDSCMTKIRFIFIAVMCIYKLVVLVYKFSNNLCKTAAQKSKKQRSITNGSFVEPQISHFVFHSM